MENLESTGVRKRHFGVTGVEIDSGVASQKKWRNFTGVNLMRIGVTKNKLASKITGLASWNMELASKIQELALLL